MRLTDTQRAEISARFARGETQAALAREFGVSTRTVRKAILASDAVPRDSDAAGTPGRCRVCGRPVPAHCSSGCRDADRSARLALRDHVVALLSGGATTTRARRSAWRLRCLVGVVDVLAGLSTPTQVSDEIEHDVRSGALEPDPDFFCDMAGRSLAEWVRRRARRRT